MMRIKICGITRYEDAALAIELGAYALGFVFWPKSPRYIEPKRVADILGQLKANNLNAQRNVGIFVNSDADQIKETVRESGIDCIQLHGDESLELCIELSDLKIWKAVRLKNQSQLKNLSDFETHIEALLFDAAAAHSFGGTGQHFDWTILQGFSSKVPLIVSGGLNTENIQQAAQALPAFAYDLSSGVEHSPGIKDPEKLRKIFEKTGSKP